MGARARWSSSALDEPGIEGGGGGMGEAEGGAPLARRPVGLPAACMRLQAAYMGLQAACGGPASSSAAGGGAPPRSSPRATPGSGSVRTRCASADLIQVGVSDGAAALLLSPG